MRRRIHFFIGLIVLSFFGINESKAQDPRFSQFYAAPMHLNPALTGVFEGKFRVALNYRDQWASILQQDPYRTIGASMDVRFNVLGNDYVTVGANFLRDQAGVNHLNHTNGHLSVSYSKQLSGSYGGNQQYLVAGGQLGLGQHQIDYDDIWFSDEFDTATETLNTLGNSAELLNFSNDAYTDVNVGLLWYALFDDNLSLYAGGALHHINAPQISLIQGGSYILPQRWTLHLGGEIPLNDELSLMPALAYIGQAGANSFTLGTNFRYSNHDWLELAVRIGTWAHISKTPEGTHAESIVFAGILELDRMNLGLSYDINVSSLVAATNSRGTVELSFIYVHPENRRAKVKCPNF